MLISHAQGLKIKAASKISCYRNVAYFIQLLSDLVVSNLYEIQAASYQHHFNWLIVRHLSPSYEASQKDVSFYSSVPGSRQCLFFSNKVTVFLIYT